ncbi:MAG: glycosyltransferase family 39 protein [Planctomycetota bacterium]
MSWDRPLWRASLAAALVLLGVALRSYRLGSWPMHGDEVSSLSEVHDFIAGQGASSNWVQATSPLAHASLALALKLAGESPLGVRLAPLVLGVLALVIAFPLVRGTFGSAIATLFVAVIAFSPDHLFISSFGRYYSALFLCGLITTGGLAMMAARNARLGLLLVVLGLTVGTAFHLTAALLLPGCLLVLVLFAADRTDRRRSTAARVLLLVLLAAIGVVFVTRYAALVHVYRNVIVNFPRALGYRPAHLFLSLASNLGMGTCLFAIAGGVHAVLARSRTGLSILAGGAGDPEPASRHRCS